MNKFLLGPLGVIFDGLDVEKDITDLKNCINGVATAARGMASAVLTSLTGTLDDFDIVYTTLTDAGQEVGSALANLISPDLVNRLPTDRQILLYNSGTAIVGVEANGSLYIDPSTGNPLSVPLTDLIDESPSALAANAPNYIALSTAMTHFSAALLNLETNLPGIVASVESLLAQANVLLQDDASTLAAGPILYRVVDATSGEAIFTGVSTSANEISFVAPANTVIRIQAVSPANMAYGEIFALTPKSGGTLNLDSILNSGDATLLLAPISQLQLPVGPSGLPDEVEEVLGGDPAKANNFVPGMTDLAALQAGLVGNEQLTSVTGVTASLPLQGEARAIVLERSPNSPAQQTAYIATGTYGLAIVDVSNARAPTILSQIDLSGTATDVGVDPNLGLAAVADGSGGLDIIDVSNPMIPTLIQSVGVDATAVQVFEGIAYANDGKSLDAIDLATGELLQTLNIGGAAITGLARDGTMLYSMDASDRLTIVDISNGFMAEKGSVVLPQGGGRLFVANGVAYVPTNNVFSGGYLTVDVSAPSSPALIQTPQNKGIESAAIALNGSGLGVGVGQDGGGSSGVVGLDVFDASDPTKTGQFLTRYTLPAQPQPGATEPFDVAIGDGIAFVADGANGLQVVNYRAFDTQAVAPTVTVTQQPTDVDPSSPGIQATEGSTATLQATISDDVQVRDVAILVNGQEVSDSVSYPWDLSAALPTIAENGSDHVTIQIQATDTGGNITTTTPVTMQLVRDTTPPVLISENITEGSVRSASFREFTFDFSKPLDVTTVTAANFTLKGPGGVALVPQSIQTGLNGKEVDVTYATLPLGQYQYVIAAAQVPDTAGNAMGASPVTTDFTVKQFSEEWTVCTITLRD